MEAANLLYGAGQGMSAALPDPDKVMDQEAAYTMAAAQNVAFKKWVHMYIMLSPPDPVELQAVMIADEKEGGNVPPP